MTINALIVTPDGESELRPIVPDLATLQGLVGGSIEPVSGPGMPFQWHAYVNEEGKYDGLAFNPTATVLAQAMGWAGPLAGDYLVGTAVFLGDDGAGEAAVPNGVVVALTALRAAGQA